MALFLIIEPNEDIRQLYAAVVRGLGHDASFLNGGPMADPESFAAALRLQRDNPALPVICASVHKPSQHIDLLEACTHLLKPFSLVELTDALQLALSQSDLLSV